MIFLFRFLPNFNLYKRQFPEQIFIEVTLFQAIIVIMVVISKNAIYYLEEVATRGFISAIKFKILGILSI